MTKFSITTEINGEHYTDAQLDRLKYERALHVAHEMLALGLPLTSTDGHTYDHRNLNWLAPDVLIQLVIDAHAALGPAKTLALYHDVLLDTDQRWLAYNQVPIEEQGCWLGTTHMTVDGINLQQFGTAVSALEGGTTAFEIMPEHFLVDGDVTTGKQTIMETFGMLGEPALTYGVASETIPDYLPIEKRPDYPVTMAGETHLVHGDENIHVGAIHQVKPTATGIDLVSTYFCPKSAPQAVADGHTIHFALEISGMFKKFHAAQSQ